MDRTERRKEALARAHAYCEANDSRLLYLTIFGSDLYGTSTGASDLDLRGVFLPSLRSIVLEKDKKHLHYSTGENEARNTSEDIDIDLWSLDEWLLRLLPEGNMGALDLIFSPSNKACQLFRSPLLDPVFANPTRFLDLPNTKSWIQYCLSQTKKYGIKGSRLGALLRAQKWLNNNADAGKLVDKMDEIVNFVDDDAHCFITDVKDGKALSLIGKLHPQGIGLKELRKRVDLDVEKLGESARKAENNQDVDFKAISHALRSLDQMEELLLTGKIVYPLKTRGRLMEVKRGDISWRELEERILSRLKEIDSLHAIHASKYPYDRAFVENFLLKCYGLTPFASENSCFAINRIN